MLAKTFSVAFEGIEVLKIAVEVQLTNGLPVFSIVGLADKAIAESRERVRSALYSIGLSLPQKHITVNLAPADVIKEGTHYDLPITLALLASMEIIPADKIRDYVIMGELGLDASIRPVSGILPAAVYANGADLGFICPYEQGAEALWSANENILAPRNLLEIIQHFKEETLLLPPELKKQNTTVSYPDFKDIKGQETAKRVMEIAAVGGHNLLMVGPPGAGKSMLASRLPSILPPMSAEELLEVSEIHSVAGLLKNGNLVIHRPFREPHHSATMPSLIGGGTKAKPGEISLAHRGVLFLDELPEFNRSVLDALRQPLETGRVSIARANAHLSYPARFQLICAMNPCKCGHFGNKNHECPRAPRCVTEYQSKISGPLLDRIDIQIEVPAVPPWKMGQLSESDDSATIAARVQKVLEFSAPRFKNLPFSRNAEADGVILESIAKLSDETKALLIKAAEKLNLSARGYHRIIRVARTIADMDFSEIVREKHLSEALSYRKVLLR